MAILSPEHLIQQGRDLIAPSGAGKPKQIALRRAISSAYYAVFHHTCITTADLWVGFVHRRTARYALVYRSVEHGGLRKLSEAASARNLPPKAAAYLGAATFGGELRSFAASAVFLQERRHTADYDPLARFRFADANLAIATAEAAIRDLAAAPDAERQAFLDLLIFAPR